MGTIFGTNLKDVLYGTSGEDKINALEDDDIVYAGTGDDFILGGLGRDTVYGGDGADTLDFRYARLGVAVSLFENIYVYGASEDIEYGSGVPRGHVYETENIIGSQYGDYLHGHNGDNILNGMDGNDVLFGYGGNDTLRGGLGNDDVYGGIGNDTLIGDEGRNYLFGEEGDDLFIGGIGIDYVSGGSGYDTVSYARSASAVGISADGGIGWQGNALGDQLFGIEAIIGSKYDDHIALLTHYGQSATRIDGGRGNDVLSGSNSANHLIGGAGDDTLYGNAGDDVLNGGAGSDVLYGDAGNDLLTGGRGADTFFFTNFFYTGFDTVQDFKASEGDKIDVRNLLTGFDPLTDAITDFVTFTQSTGAIVLNVDPDGLENLYAAKAIATLTGVTAEPDETSLIVV